MCLINGNSSRQESFDDCLDRNGRLAELFGEGKMIPIMNDNHKYWLSVYRTFQHSGKYSMGMACLAVTRVHDTLYLDPDNCESQKAYLCKENIPTPQESTIASLDTSSAVRTAETKDKNDKSDTNKESPLAYIVPTISLLAFFIVVVVFVAYIRRRKRKNKSSQNIYDEMYEVDNFKNNLTASSVCSEPGLNADSKCLIAKSKPDKPLRQTLKRNTQGIDYENFALKDKRNEDLREKTKSVEIKQSKEYDKIEFKRKKNERKDAYEDSNVYHHVVDENGDNYDTIKSAKSCHSRDKIDNSYSRMKDGLIADEYCGIAPPINNQNDCNMENKDDFVQTEQQSEAEKAPTPRFIIIDDEPLTSSDGENEIDNDKNIAYTEIATVDYLSDVRDDKANESLTSSSDVSNSFDQIMPNEPELHAINEQSVALNTNKLSKLESENIARNVGTVFKENDKDKEGEDKDNGQLNYVDIVKSDATLSDEDNDNT